VQLTHTLLIAADHPALAGHFPAMPMLPGVVLLDEALRLIGDELDLDLAHWQIAAAKFLSPVRPGEQVVIEVAAQADLVRFGARVADRAALSGTLSRVPTGSHAR
jgi:3-hydroxymyristoyl/3-hydroxydecanoyl-(acyl carrier protein) dehydratase